MKVAVFGTGAIGSHVAGRIAKGGRAEVSVIARGPQLEGIRANGITVDAPDATFNVKVRAEQDPARLGPQDAVVITVKAPALTGVADAIAPLLGPETPVVFVINGIPWWWGDGLDVLDPTGSVREKIGLARTIGGVVWSACTVTSPGTVKVASATSKVVFGELDGSITPRATALAEALQAGGMGGVASPDIRTEIWTKLLNNLVNGPICLLSRRHMKGTFDEPILMEAALTVMREALEIAKALGHPIPGDAEKQILRSVVIAHKPSILQDLEQGRGLEFDALFTVPLQLARQAGVRAPTLELLVALARKGAHAA
ncbi:2-dehydropantoate 2-reductase [Roseococcus sp. SYP-B2431]|uniref:ketopantoate reductase family protein n=1 Tax=Roseococcus sp. SYP-B2431 TaxID=2496640 RepID=UPI00103C9677|nr:2-dehydropantoate 2-reductase [Roseococcus sp. SYP-B2431]TCH98727.1 2-dehydropantoate 2-reductase [Roseococcus sp. SYP-B2431]